MDEVKILHQDAISIKHLCSVDKRLERVITAIGPISYSTDHDDFIFLVNTIIGQMLSNTVADVLSERFLSLCNGTISPDIVLSLSDTEMRGIGLAYSKARFLKNLSEAVKKGSIDFDEISQLPDREAIARLTSVNGIGTWSAKMYLIFVLDRPDVLPFEDMAFIQSFKWLYLSDNASKETIEKKCKKWKP